MSTTSFPQFSNPYDKETSGDLPKGARVHPGTKPLPTRTRLTSAGQGRFATKSLRPAFAVGELLIVLAAVGLVIVCIMAVIPTGDHDYGTTAAPPTVIEEVELLHDYMVSLGKDYFCTVTLRRFERPETPLTDNHTCRVRIVRRHPLNTETFLIEILASQRTSWYDGAEYSTWTLYSAQAGRSFLQVHKQAEMNVNGLTQEQHQIRLSFYREPDFFTVSNMDQVLADCVPDALVTSGMIVISKSADLRDIGQLSPFPLREVATAIRSTAKQEQWNVKKLSTLFHDKPLVVPNDNTVAHSLIYGLLEHVARDSESIH